MPHNCDPMFKNNVLYMESCQQNMLCSQDRCHCLHKHEVIQKRYSLSEKCILHIWTAICIYSQSTASYCNNNNTHGFRIGFLMEWNENYAQHRLSSVDYIYFILIRRREKVKGVELLMGHAFIYFSCFLVLSQWWSGKTSPNFSLFYVPCGNSIHQNM